MAWRLFKGRRPQQCIALALVTSLLASLPTLAAEEIFFRYGSLERSVRLSSVEALVNEGRIEDDLALYLDLVGLSEAETDQLRRNLDRPLPLDGVLLSRFFYTDLGEELLEQVGTIVQTRSRQNGLLALRAALVQAATSPEGLSPLSVLRYLPVDMEINVADALAVANAVDRVIAATTDAIVQLEALSTEQVAQGPPIDYAELADLTAAGPARVMIQRFDLTDSSRDGQASAPRGHRQLYVDVVRPQQWRGQAPVMVFSHGLSSSPEAWHQWASHLASHGIVVVLPQHPGSDAQKVATFQAGLTQDIFEAQEFIDRPLDLTFVLDQLDQLNPSEIGGQLDLAQVGVGGHSLGGYTALAVAGAEINLPYLEQVCGDRFLHLNPSLLLQCQALQQPPQPYDLRDPRVTSVMLFNPVSSSIFGPEGLAAVAIPVMVMAGSHDPATPAVFEQFRTFPWYTSDSRSLALIEGQAHVDLSELDAGLANLLEGLPWLSLAQPEVIDRYLNALSLAFVGRYAGRRPEYSLYLRSGYAQYLSEGQTFGMVMVNAGTDVDRELTQPLGDRLEPVELPNAPIEGWPDD
ncbi:alpha/beta hydrolase [Nodosilinea sp. LEGE 07088]|uniref:alpha/beta hydrolase n=1 Tax=Nodosilinea sp. LEGE 07088 TaxID=2777968 RepID=UPI00187F6E02|nr:alpha/beta hydrolase [Nodosilinea sp. LEGE 07088]MBE9140443.1 alpha/beta hydrolase [Nodosilinea sp. LEGE 07088]